MSKPVKFSDLFEPLGDGRAELDALTKSIQTLSRNTKTFATNLEGNSQRIAAGLATILSQSAGLREQTTQLNLLNERERQGLAALQTQVAQLVREQQRLKDAQEAQAKAQQVVNDATKQAQTAYRALQNELREAYKAQDTARIERAALAIRQARTETASLSAALRGTNTELTAARGSYDALDAQNKRLIATLKGLEGGIEGSEEKAAALQAQIAQNTAKLQEFDSRILIFTRNVGNYKGGFSELVAELAKARAAQEGMTAGTADYQAQQTRILGFQTAAQKSAAQMGLSYEQAEARINGAGEALRPLATTLVRLEREQLNLAGTTGTESEEYRKLGFQIQSAKKQLDDVAVSTTKMSQSGGLTSALGFDKSGLLGALTQLTAGMVGFQAIVSGVGTAVHDTFAADAEFESALGSLSALTGATGEDLQFLADKAEELRPKVGKSAAETLKAFELVGSAQPELLKSGQALASVTEQALLLAAASKEELPAAAESLTGVMNQFQASAQEAGRYVNALAAGAKEGAATIPQTAESLKYFGVNAASANISVEKSVALIQTLADRSIKGEQAGTQLRAVLARLAAGAKETNPEVVGLSTALDNLAKQNLTTAQYTKLFGLENANSAKVLVENRQRVEELTVAVTGTNVANEQATKQLDNINAASARFGATFKNVAITALEPFVRGLSNTLNQLSSLFSKLSGGNKTIQETTAATQANGLANAETARSAQALLTRYEDLVAKGVKPTKDGKGELNQITLQLRDSLGESAAAIDKETGQLVLNEEATRNLIKQKLLLSNQAVSTLVLQADALKGQIKQQEQANGATQQEIATRERLTGISKEQAAAMLDIRDAGEQLPGQGMQNLYQATIKLGDGRANLQKLRDEYNATLLALNKFGPEAVKLAQEQADAQQKNVTAAGDAAKGAEVILDRNLKAQAELRRTDLQNQLADTQKRIDDIKKLQTEQGKLFDDHQISPEVLRASVATTQDQITTLERDASALRIKILRTERDEKLYTINDEAVKASKAKGVSSAELVDIEKAAATKRLAVVRQFNYDVLKEQRALQEKQEVKPIEFKVAQVDETKFLEDNNRKYLLTYQRRVQDIQSVQQAADDENLRSLVGREITQRQYLKQRQKNRADADQEELRAAQAFGKDTRDIQRKIYEHQQEDQEDALQQRLARIDYAGQQAQLIEQSFYQIKGNLIDAQIQQENAAYENELKVAGNNAKLKEQIEAAHQKRLAKLNYDKAKAERDAALFSIAINTAVAVAKSIAESPETFGLPFSAIALATGAIQAAVVLSKPLPAYFKGRAGGPAETALVGEQGAELIGQPSTGYRLASKPSVVQLRQHDVVHTATETRTILAQNELVEGRLVQRAQQTDMERQTTQLRTGHRAQQEAEAQALRQSNAEVLAELRQVRRAIKEQEYYRLNEQDDLVRRSH